MKREAEPPDAVRALGAQVDADGGRTLAVYREPIGDHWQVFCLLPIDKVEPTPYQRDLSPTHVKRLQEVVRKVQRFVDPIVVVSPRPGLYRTPNGHHRLAVLRKPKADVVPAILVPEAEVAFQILALNTASRAEPSRPSCAGWTPSWAGPSRRRFPSGRSAPAGRPTRPSPGSWRS